MDNISYNLGKEETADVMDLWHRHLKINRLQGLVL
jgi:hypothetical protein